MMAAGMFLLYITKSSFPLEYHQNDFRFNQAFVVVQYLLIKIDHFYFFAVYAAFI